MSKEEEKPIVYITGFGSFHGVTENPTQIFVETIQKDVNFLDQKNYKLVSTEVLEVSMNAVDDYFQKISQQDVQKKKVFFLHFGVHGRTKEFILESKAKNEANFGVPDEKLNFPKNEKIERNFELDHWNSTSIVKKLNSIVLDLNQKYPVKLGDDPGRFVCNYMYYQSLKFSEVNGTCSLFIHVPDQSLISIENQMIFFNELMEKITE
eukprot:gene5908-9738_t